MNNISLRWWAVPAWNSSRNKLLEIPCAWPKCDEQYKLKAFVVRKESASLFVCCKQDQHTGELFRGQRRAEAVFVPAVNWLLRVTLAAIESRCLCSSCGCQYCLGANGHTTLNTPVLAWNCLGRLRSGHSVEQFEGFAAVCHSYCASPRLFVSVLEVMEMFISTVQNTHLPE